MHFRVDPRSGNVEWSLSQENLYTLFQKLITGGKVPDLDIGG